MAIYGTSGGVPVTDELIAKLAAEAEARGFDPLPNMRGANGAVAANVLRLRTEKRMSQQTLLNRLAEHGCKFSSLDMIRRTEQGLRRISVNELVALAAALDVTVADLLTEPA